MKKINLLTAVSLVCISQCVAAATVTTVDVKITDISISPVSGDVILQTAPAINLAGLTCAAVPGLIIPKDSVDGYKATLSLLISAQTGQRKIDVTASDVGAVGNCKLTKLVVKGM